MLEIAAEFAYFTIRTAKLSFHVTIMHLYNLVMFPLQYHRWLVGLDMQLSVISTGNKAHKVAMFQYSLSTNTH